MSAARFCIALMDLAKLQVLSSFYFMAAEQSLPPVVFSVSFLLALGLNRILRARDLRVIVHLAANLLGLALTFSALGVPCPGLPPGLRAMASEGSLFLRLSIPAWSLAYWLRGAWLARKKADHAFCVARFDENLAVILGVLCLAARFRASNPWAERLILPALLAGILALGAAKRENARSGGLSRGSRQNSLPAGAAAFILGSAGILAATPALLDPARRAGQCVHRAFKALEPGLADFLRRLLGFRPPAIPAAGAASGNGIAAPGPVLETGQADRVLARVFLWALGAVLVLLFAVLLASALAALFRSLFRRVIRDRDGPRGTLLPAWLRAVLCGWARLSARLGVLLSCKPPTRSAAEAAYSRYLACGLRAGQARKPQETPREYARRLAGVFPRSAERALLVVEALELEAYGGKNLEPETERTLDSIRKRTRLVSFQAERLGNLRLRRKTPEAIQ